MWKRLRQAVLRRFAAMAVLLAFITGLAIVWGFPTIANAAPSSSQKWVFAKQSASVQLLDDYFFGWRSGEVIAERIADSYGKRTSIHIILRAGMYGSGGEFPAPYLCVDGFFTADDEEFVFDDGKPQHLKAVIDATIPVYYCVLGIPTPIPDQPKGKTETTIYVPPFPPVFAGYATVYLQLEQQDQIPIDSSCSCRRRQKTVSRGGNKFSSRNIAGISVSGVVSLNGGATFSPVPDSGSMELIREMSRSTQYSPK